MSRSSSRVRVSSGSAAFSFTFVYLLWPICLFRQMYIILHDKTVYHVKNILLTSLELYSHVLPETPTLHLEDAKDTFQPVVMLL